MKRLINNIVSIVYTLPKFLLIKIFHGSNFRFHLIERFSPDTDIYFIGRGSMVFGNKVRAHSGCKFRTVDEGRIIVEDNATFNYGCMLTAHDYIHIGKGVEFGPNVLLYDNDHDFRAEGGLKAGKFKKGPIEIGDNTWIGANVVLLRNTKIGKNCVVAAGTILGNCEYPDNTVIYQKRETLSKPY